MNEKIPSTESAEALEPTVSLDIKSEIEPILIARFANSRESPKRRKEALTWIENYGKAFEQILKKEIDTIGGEEEFRKLPAKERTEIVERISHELEINHYL